MSDCSCVWAACNAMHREHALAIGQELQLERERRAISLESIAKQTKVPQRHLLALEGEHFDQLPGGIFVRGIVRSYCRHLGLNEEEWLVRLPGAQPQESSQEWTEFAENISRSRISNSAAMGMRWWGVLAMVAALGALAWVAWQYVLQP